MKFFLRNVIMSLCVSFLAASETYRAASVLEIASRSSDYASFIHDAVKYNADILVLPAPELPRIEDNYDETIKTLSQAAKQSNIYLVAHLYEKTSCHSKVEMIRSNVVIDREGAIVAVSRKPQNQIANCTEVDSQLVTFDTDFGVTFGLLMEEDIVLQDMDKLENLKNYVMSGGVTSEIPFLRGDQLSPSWSYVNNVNLVSTKGIFTGRIGTKTEHQDGLVISDVNKNGHLDSTSLFPADYNLGVFKKRVNRYLLETTSTPPVLNPVKLGSLEDLSQYTIRPLSTSSEGHKETVCHGNFCCEFDIKIASGDQSNVAQYFLAAFDGVRQYSGGHHVGIRTCAILACAGLDNRACVMKSQNTTTNITFENISIAANFTKQNSIQYPIVHATDIPSNGFKFISQTGSHSQSSIEINNAQNVITVGIFGRVFDKDFQTDFVVGNTSNSDNINEIYNDEILELFDYLWIRLRVVIFVVSIYILEMM